MDGINVSHAQKSTFLTLSKVYLKVTAKIRPLARCCLLAAV
jgi:hypothetical protein